jgi:hypothetical protein
MTAAGQAAIKAAAPRHVTSTRHYVFDLLSDKEVGVLTAAFDRILANLEGAGKAGDGTRSHPTPSHRRTSR